MIASEAMAARDRAILAARRRGHSQRTIAAALGVSYQAVQQRLQLYEPISAHIRRKKIGGEVLFICVVCGTQAWCVPHKRARLYCSKACAGFALRLLSEKDVQWAVEMRGTGAMTWTTIARRLGVTIQGIQNRIWRSLHKKGLLTVPVVVGIWKPRNIIQDNPPAWNWLERTTGLVAVRSA